MAKNYYYKYYVKFAKSDFSLSCCLFLPLKLLGIWSKLSCTHSFGPPINTYLWNKGYRTSLGPDVWGRVEEKR